MKAVCCHRAQSQTPASAVWNSTWTQSIAAINSPLLSLIALYRSCRSKDFTWQIDWFPDADTIPDDISLSPLGQLSDSHYIIYTADTVYRNRGIRYFTENISAMMCQNNCISEITAHILTCTHFCVILVYLETFVCRTQNSLKFIWRWYIDETESGHQISALSDSGSGIR